MRSNETTPSFSAVVSVVHTAASHKAAMAGMSEPWRREEDKGQATSANAVNCSVETGQIGRAHV